MEDTRKMTENTAEQYEKPEMEVVELNGADMIVASACANVYVCSNAYTF